jgi:hypothetical protein
VSVDIKTDSYVRNMGGDFQSLLFQKYGIDGSRINKTVGINVFLLGDENGCEVKDMKVWYKVNYWRSIFPCT